MAANSTDIKPCLESTLSVELASYQPSPALYGLLLAICIINGLSSVLTTLANSFILLIILNSRPLRTQSNIPILFLAFTDVLVGVVVQPAFVVYLAGKLRLKFPCAALLTYLYAEIFCVGLSLITLSLLACDRFFAILYPFKYINYVTTRRLVKAVGVVWTVWLLFNVICRALKVKNDEFFSPVASVIIGACLILNIILYFKIFKIIRRHEKQVHAQNKVHREIQSRHSESALDRRNSSPPSARETRMARTVAYITGILVLCYSPLMFTSLADMLIEDDALFDHLLYPLAETVAFLNSALNPFLYCWRCKELRQKMLLCFKGAQQTTVERVAQKQRSQDTKEVGDRS